MILPEVGRALFQFVVDDDALLGAQLVDHALDLDRRNDGVGSTVQEQARGRAGRQEAEIIHVRRRRHGDEAVRFRAAHQKLHADIGAELIAGDPGLGGGRVIGLQPVQGGGRVGQLADAAVELALRLADAARVVAQGGEATLDEQLVQRDRHRVVHMPARLGVRMQNQGDGRVGALARRVAAFDAARGAGKNDFRHGSAESCLQLSFRERTILDQRSRTF